MMNHLAHVVFAFVFAFVVAFLCYQSDAFAANNFTAIPIKSGDTLISILRQQGFSDQERGTILNSTPQIQKLFLTLDTCYLIRKAPHVTELRIYDSQSSEAYKILKQNGKVTSMPYHPEYKITLQRIEGRIQGSILGSILVKIDSNFVASRFNDAYAFDLKSKKSLQPRAKYWFTVQKRYDQGQFIKYGEILQTSLELDGRAVRKNFIRSANGGIFFNSESLTEKRPLYAPVNYLKIASRFQPHRLHPITGRLQAHLGVDFELPTGEPVFAPRDGIVKRYGRSTAAGNFIVLHHSNGFETFYNHLSRIDKNIYQGKKMSLGDKIAEVGCTGYCTRAHLHFAIKIKGKMVDPLNYIKPYPHTMEQQLTAKVARN